ncbi:hypothetical protein CLV37_101682 [Kineococcus rhizosphaerae]|uniref:Phosphotransferase family enzyme n=1 Tax=Kineococcus rhizosphaerae TaxID=559628 RepID=A0A2T0RBB7_9ACTN|nr:hypothetical protein CLV37_101682 [Kineococcus rhizosphaerae]
MARRGDDVVTVASRAGLRPYGLHAALAAGAPATGPWVLVLGHGDALTRAVFVAAGSDFRREAVAVKLARLPGAAGVSFDRDAHGLALASAAGATHVPRLLGGFTVDGARGSVESAGGGEQVGRFLVRSAAQAALPLVEAVAEWTTNLGLTTREPHGLDRGLAADLAAVPGAAEPLSAVAGVPGVLAHNDLGSWNLVTRGTDFTVLDWESARAGGLPLADALYFLTDALGLLAGARTQQERCAAAVALHTGRAEGSPLLFRWLRRAASALQLPPDAVGPLAMLTWLSHSTSRGQRLRRLDDEAVAAEEPYAGRLADAWRHAPELGATWPAFTAWSAR